MIRYKVILYLIAQINEEVLINLCFFDNKLKIDYVYIHENMDYR